MKSKCYLCFFTLLSRLVQGWKFFGVAIFILSAMSAFAGNGALGDPNIKYFGRWDFSNPAQYMSYWGGAYIKAEFNGTTVKIKVGGTTSYYARIDNGPWITYSNVTGTVNLTPTPLANGTHMVSVAQGKDYSYVFNFQGLILDTGATTTALTVAPTLIEYIGDSITTGYTDAQADVSDYAWVCSESLGAEHTQIAFPGIALVTGYGVNTDKTGMDSQYFKLQSLTSGSNSPSWDFTKYRARAVVINLGQNDSSDTDALFQSTYTTFLANVRTKYPNAEIFVMRTFSGRKATPTLAAVNARITAGDSKVHYIDTTNWLNSGDFGDGVHPTVSGHIKAANLLKPILAPYIGGVTFYQNTSYAGAGGRPLTPGNYTMAQLLAMGVTNDWASSLTIPANWTVTMYSSDNFTGTSWVLTTNAPSLLTLSPSANDQMSSCKIVGPTDGAVYHLICQKSGMALDNNNSLTAGTTVIQWPDSLNNSNQEWQVIDVGGGYWNLLCQKSQMDLDNGGSTTTGTPVTQYSIRTNNNQRWQLLSRGSGYYHLICQTSGMALDNGGATTNSAAMTQWTDHGATDPNVANQNWTLELIR